MADAPAQETTTPAPAGGFALLLTATLIGIVDSVYLLATHVKLKAGQGLGTGLCNVNESLNCEAAALSQFSELFGLPIAGLGLSFYVGSLFLIPPLRANPGDRRIILELLGSFYALAVAYSIFLGLASVFKLGSACPACMVLYVVNIAGMIGVWWMGGGSPIGCIVGTLKSIGAHLRRPGFIGFLMTFALVLLVSGSWAKNEIAQRKQELKADTPTKSFPLEKVRATYAPALGPVDASILVSVFSDFECPHCARFAETLHRAHRAFPDKLRVEFRPFPLSFHPNAKFASLVGICAHQQGRFWDFHDQVFEHQRELSPGRILTLAEAVGLDRAAMSACAKDPQTAELLQREIAVGGKLGIQGTPAFLLNGKFYAGGREFDEFLQMIEEAS